MSHEVPPVTSSEGFLAPLITESLAAFSLQFLMCFLLKNQKNRSKDSPEIYTKKISEYFHGNFGEIYLGVSSTGYHRISPRVFSGNSTGFSTKIFQTFLPVVILDCITKFLKDFFKVFLREFFGISK